MSVALHVRLHPDANGLAAQLAVLLRLPRIPLNDGPSERQVATLIKDGASIVPILQFSTPSGPSLLDDIGGGGPLPENDLLMFSTYSGSKHSGFIDPEAASALSLLSRYFF